VAPARGGGGGRPKRVGPPVGGAWLEKQAHALAVGVDPERFWLGLRGSELVLREMAAAEKARDLRLELMSAAWHAALWIRGGIPRWSDVESSITGEPRRYPTPEELRAKAKSFGVGVWSPGEAARG
jgi:hypothetical protein